MTVIQKKGNFFSEENKNTEKHLSIKAQRSLALSLVHISVIRRN